MSFPQSITLILDRRLLEHPQALHLRRMRAGVWLYLDLLARLPQGAGALEVEPAAVGQAMGLPEGTIRSWLGHLRRSGYLEAERLNGAVRVTIRSVHAPTPAVVAPTPQSPRIFTVEKIEDALGDRGHGGAIEAALRLHSDSVIRRALAGSLAVPGPQIRRSRTALFLYLLKRYQHASTN